MPHEHPLHEHLHRVHKAHRAAYDHAHETAAAAAAELEAQRATSRLVDTEATDVARQQETHHG